MYIDGKVDNFFYDTSIRIYLLLIKIVITI